MPKGPIVGNQLCWFGNFVYLTKDLTDPTQKLVQQYNCRQKKFGLKNVGDKPANKALETWCELCGIGREKVNNMWARKSMINTALHELLLPEQMVMNLSGHKSAYQMRKDYCKIKIFIQGAARSVGSDGRQRPVPSNHLDVQVPIGRPSPDP